MNIIKRKNLVINSNISTVFNKFIDDNNNFILKVIQNNYNIFIDYKIYFICIDINGNKYINTLDNIEIFLDIRKENAKINNYLINLYQTISEKSYKIEKIYLKPFEYYSEKTVQHDRVYFKNLYNYKIINELISKNDNLKDVLCQNEGYTTYYNKELQFRKIKLYDNVHNNLLLLTFDIEVYSLDEASMPNASIKEDEIFMICGTFHNYNSTKIIKSFIITTREIDNVDKEFENAEVLYYYCKTEYKLLETFIEIIKNTSPEFITGFNDFSFDHPYIRDRINNFYPELLVKMYHANNIIELDSNRINYEYHTYKKSMAKLSAEDMVETAYPKSDSIIYIDSRIQLRKIYPNEPKSSLNFFLDLLHLGSKDDITVQQMRRAYEKHDKKAMKDIAHYCLVDAFSCQKLLVKKQVINEAMKMGDITGITLEDALNRASGFKIFKLMTKFGLEQDPLYSFQYKKMHPNLDDENGEFMGGYVKAPIYGIKYKTPVFALDYSSLYPSVMRTYNISHDSFIKDEELEKFKQNNIPYHTFELTGKKINIIDHLDKPELTGIVPKILADLLNRRKLIKKGLIEIKAKKELCSKEEAEKFEFEERDLDQKQKAVKVLANSIYGITGARTAGTLYRKEIAECVTMNGRRMVQEAIRFIEEKNYIVHYGDSVTYDTPCLVKNIETEEIEYKPICDLYDNDDWIPNIIDNKEYNTCSKYLVWSNNGWTAIKSVMRHKVEKKIFRINTHIGCVDVTEDHSLYTDKNIKISPKDCTLETKLLHKKYDLEWEFDNKINKEYAFILGYFASDGTCGIYNTKWGVKNNWYLDSMDLETLEKICNLFKKYENQEFKILTCSDKTNGFKQNQEQKDIKSIYRIVPQKIVKPLVEKYRKMFYNSIKEKIIPIEILNSNIEIQKEFFKGFYLRDGNKGDYFKQCGSMRIDGTGKAQIAGLMQLCNNIDYQVSVNASNKKLNVYSLTITKRKDFRKNPIQIKKILDVTDKYKDTYVYDFETNNHHFHAGIGSIIVSNTDSATFDSPCLLKNIETEEILYKPICELADDNNWLNEINDRQFNVCTKYLVWCKNGWTKIKHIMRHKTDKTIHRVLTHTGCVDVTTDHSLLDINGEMIKSTECKIKDTKLYHNKYEQEWTYDYEINEEYAYLLGFFFADGTCCTTVSNKPHYEWQINNIKLEWLEKLLPIAEKYEKQEFIIQKIKHDSGNGFKPSQDYIYILRPNLKRKECAIKYRKMFYNSLREKFVPTEILNSDYKVQKAFLDGFYVGDGNKSVHRTGNYFDIAGKTSVAGMFQLIQNIGNITAINAYTKKLNVYMLTINEKMKYGREPNTVKKILDVTDKYKDTYVYDLETEDHTFHAGIGNMIVHNSAYSSLKEDEFKEYDEQFKQNKIDIKKLIELKMNKTKEHLIKLNKELNEHLIEFTKYKYLSVAYEEVLYPSFFIAKKIYVAVEHINVVNELDIDKNLFVRGFSIIRRNTTELTKEVIKNNLLKKLFSYEAMEKAHLEDNFSIENIIKDEINNVIYNFNRNRYPLEYFIKNDKYSPNKKNIRVNKFIENLTKFIETLNDDDLKLKYAIPEPGDRFEYVFIDKPGKTEGLGEIMQYPFYIDDFSARLNYARYFESEISNEFGCLLCEDNKRGKRYVLKLFEMINDGYPFDELKTLTIDELLDYKNTVKKDRQKKALQDKKEKKNNQLDNIKELFNGNDNYKIIELFGFFINDENDCIFKNIDKIISKMDLRETHHLQSSIYKKYHNNQYKESKIKDLLIDKLTKEKNKNKKIIQEFINNNYNNIKQLILEQLEQQEINLNINNIEKINDILKDNLNKEILKSYIDNCLRIFKINEYKKYIQLIKQA